MFGPDNKSPRSYRNVDWIQNEKKHIRVEAAFKTYSERKVFHKNYNRHDEEERYSLNHRKVITIYCAPKYHNTIFIHFISALYSYLYSKTSQWVVNKTFP